ncbi:MAG: hypothetical protein LUG83_10715 [Lachnospiraceae bacterium]|nr:hypothetical protein [Lachnospiraceae bacterium]
MNRKRNYMRIKHIHKKNAARGLAAVILGSVLLTGCGNMIPDMTEEEEQEIGEYAAMLLLRYDANHRSRLVDLSLIEENEENTEPGQTEEAQTPEKDEQPSVVTVVNNSSERTAQGAASIAQFLGLPDGVSIDYSDMKVCDSYPDDGQTNSFFSLDASSGKKLLVLNFEMANNSGAEQSIDILSQTFVFKITVNNSYTRTALVTMLTNDLSTYIGSMAAGEKEEVVLMIEIDEEMADNIGSVLLTLVNDADTFAVSLQ